MEDNTKEEKSYDPIRFNSSQRDNFSSVELPKILPKKDKKWVYWGGDNLFPEFVINLYAHSSVNKTCIDAIADATCGKGLKTSQGTLDYALKLANPEDSWDEVFEKCALDYVLFGGFAMRVIWGVTGTQISQIYYEDFSKIRPEKRDSEGKVCYYYVSDDWRGDRFNHTSKVKAVKFPAFSPELAETGECLEQIFYFYDKFPGQDYYPNPKYIGSFNDIQVDALIPVFHVSNLTNGMVPSLHIHQFIGNVPREERDGMHAELEGQFSGARNGGRLLTTFSLPGEAPVITPLNLANDNYYSAMQDRVEISILSAHHITSPLLLGIRAGTSGLGSNADEITTAWKVFQFNVIRLFQKPLLKTFGKFFKLSGYNDDLQIVPLNIFESSSEVVEEEQATSENSTK